MASRRNGTASPAAVIEAHEEAHVETPKDVIDRTVSATSDAVAHTTEEMVDTAEKVVESIFATQTAESGSWPPPLFVHRNASEMEQYYVRHRWQSQWLYYDAKATENKKNYQALQLVIGVGSVAVPVLLGMEWIPNIIPVAISLVVAAAAAVENVKKYGDNWRSYRQAAEELQREKALFDVLTGPYKRAKQPFLRFVERCEDVIAQQNGQFLQRQDENEKKEDNTADASASPADIG